MVPPKHMLEFSRRQQEERLAAEQEKEMQELTEDEADLEEKLNRLNHLDKKFQDYSFAVTSLQEDRVRPLKRYRVDDKFRVTVRTNAMYMVAQHTLQGGIYNHYLNLM